MTGVGKDIERARLEAGGAYGAQEEQQEIPS